MPLSPSLTRRRCEPEIMDDPGLDPARHLAALRGLARLNRLSQSAAILWPALHTLARHVQRPIRVLDVASGAGDVPLALHRLARQQGINLHITGCDISERAVAHARQNAAAAGACSDVRFFRLDVLKDPLPAGYDAVTCSLFLHHLQEADALALLAAMAAAARHRVLISDLRRSPSGLALAFGASRLFSRSDVVRTDAVLSVRAAFTIDEVRALARRAGLQDVSVTPRRPCRLLLDWRRS